MVKFDGRRQKTLSLTAFSFQKTKNQNLEEWEGGGGLERGELVGYLLDTVSPY